MAIDILIMGALGRMGIEIAKVIQDDPSVKLAAAVEYPSHPKMGENYGQCIGADFGGLKVTSSLEQAGVADGVIIDFSSVQSTRSLLERASEHKKPMVVGTTGLEKSDYELAEKAAQTIPVVVSPNMSLGVNLLFSLTELVSKRLKGSFDIEIVEAHHRFKKDSPSGTARRLGEIVADALEKSYDEAIVNGRSGMASSTRSSSEVGMHAVRGGDIVGDHTVLFAGMGERVELRHMAHSRSTFARGAVETAKWLSSKQPGSYTMKDVLGL